MAELRTDYAEDFLQKNISCPGRWMSRNHLVYDIQAARWSSVIGRKKPVLTPAEKKLLIALTPDRMPPGDKLTETLLDIFHSFTVRRKKENEKTFKDTFQRGIRTFAYSYDADAGEDRSRGRHEISAGRVSAGGVQPERQKQYADAEKRRK